jgi:hypothetical protein
MAAATPFNILDTLWAEDALFNRAGLGLVLHKFALWCANRALSGIPKPDPRIVNMLEAKQRWLVGKCGDGGLQDARKWARGSINGKAAYWSAHAAASPDPVWAAALASKWAVTCVGDQLGEEAAAKEHNALDMELLRSLHKVWPHLFD